MSKRFTIHENDKRLEISGVDDLEIFIDYDDVWHTEVMRKAKKLCAILEEHWPRE